MGGHVGVFGAVGSWEDKNLRSWQNGREFTEKE